MPKKTVTLDTIQVTLRADTALACRHFSPSALVPEASMNTSYSKLYSHEAMFSLDADAQLQTVFYYRLYRLVDKQPLSVSDSEPCGRLTSSAQVPDPSPRHCITWALHHSSLDKTTKTVQTFHARDHFLKVSVSLASTKSLILILSIYHLFRRLMRSDSQATKLIQERAQPRQGELMR